MHTMASSSSSSCLKLDTVFSSTIFKLKRSNATANFNMVSPKNPSFSALSSSSMFSSKLPFLNTSHSHSLPIKASSSSSTAVAEPEGIKVNSVPTKPIEGQKTGTSGLRKKVKVFMEENYLANWIQALFNSLPPEDYK
ncbi:hypothetical protein Tsubulata_031900, partial [Turnera subulata]